MQARGGREAIFLCGRYLSSTTTVFVRRVRPTMCKRLLISLLNGALCISHRYFPDLTRDQTEKHLAGQATGTFLVRHSGAQACYCLSIVYVLELCSGGSRRFLDRRMYGLPRPCK